MKPGGFACLTATLVVCIVANLACAPPSHAQLIGCEPTGTGSCIADMPGPAPGEEFTDLSSGIFTYSKTDMSLPGAMPINVTRVYRSSDKVGSNWNARDFGLGTRLNYDIFLYSKSEVASGQFTDAEIVMPDGGMIECQRSDTYPATDYVDAVFACNEQPTGVWFGATIRYNSSNSGWDLKRVDGTTYHFGFNAPLQTITDRFNNYISITRGGTSPSSLCSNPIPATSINTITSSDGRTVSFCYDQLNYPDGISTVTDNSSVGKVVNYTYGTNKQLNTVTQTALNPNAKTTYTYNQGLPSGIGNLTTITVNYVCAGTNCSSPSQFLTYVAYVSNALGTAVYSVSSQVSVNGYTYHYTIPSGWTSAQIVTVTLPDSSKRTLTFDANGYVLNDDRNVGVQTTNAEHTVFERNLPPVGTVGIATGTTEFVGEVQEQDQNPNTVRQTTYTYDNNGNILSTALSPAPGDVNPCCGSTATWNYAYTTFNRVASAAEPLAYAGVGTTYSYVDTPSQPSMTIIDPLGRPTTVLYNPQGQPIQVTDPISSSGSSTYNSYGDLQSTTDPAGATTHYQTDPDGRVLQVTSPLNEYSAYKYDALDDVTDMYVDPSSLDPGGLNLHTSYTYDLIGEVASYTTPKGETTKIARTKSLTTTTVTDPLNYTTVTVVDGQGGASTYKDKRGDVTAYTYDAFGRLSTVGFNGKFDVTVGINDTDGAYDALDRPEGVYLLTGATQTWSDFTYDSADNVLSEQGWQTGGSSPLYSLNYQYDANGRRINLAPTSNGNAQPSVNYGYDCADELVSMSNNGSAVQSCSPGNSVTNGDFSTQVAFNYDGDGNPNWTLVDGVWTVFDGRDADERVTQEDFISYPGYSYYGGLQYIYDSDGRVIDKTYGLAAVNLPPNNTATYNADDQLLTWNGASVSVDAQQNITKDPVLGLSYTWNARNQLAAISGGITETYDAFGRRVAASSPGHNLSLLHDGSTVIGATDSAVGSLWTFLGPGSALAGSFTSGGVTTTWVPLIDAAGSTIALVNAAQTGSPPPTTFTYDPFGDLDVTGLSNSFPFQYQGSEHEITDPGNLYFNPSGNVYNPQIQRGLSQVGQQGLSGPGNGAFGPGRHGGSQGGMSPWQVLNDEAIVFNAPFIFTPGSEGIRPSIPLSIFESIINFFSGGGSSAPAIPRQMRYHRHPIYPYLGIAPDLTPTQVSAKCPCPTAPVLPKGNVDDNIRATQQHSKAWFGWQEWPGHEWDFKSYPGGMKWDNAGNFNYGACGRAAGFSDYQLQSFGGGLQIYKGTNGPGVPFLIPPYGESKSEEIRDGERYYDCGCY